MILFFPVCLFSFPFRWCLIETVSSYVKQSALSVVSLVTVFGWAWFLSVSVWFIATTLSPSLFFKVGRWGLKSQNSAGTEHTKLQLAGSNRMCTRTLNKETANFLFGWNEIIGKIKRGRGMWREKNKKWWKYLTSSTY